MADGLSPERDAWRIKDQRSAVEAHRRTAQDADRGRRPERRRHQARQRPAGQPNRPVDRASQARREMSKTLVYERTGEGDKYLPLIISPENAKASVGGSIAGAVRHRQLDARGAARDQHAGQPAARAALRRRPDGAPDVDAAGGGGRLMTETAARRSSMLHDPAEALDPLADAEDARGQEPGQGRLGPSVVAALHLRSRRDHGPAGVLGDAGRARRLGADLEAARVHPDHRRAAPAQRRAPAPRPPGRRAASVPVATEAERIRQRRRTTSASRRGCSRSGCAAPAATTSGPLPRFTYTNTHPFRPDLAQFTHKSCPGRGSQRAGSKPVSARAPPFRPSIC